MDCEAVRLALTAEYSEDTPEKRKWSVLGQSFGGFCCVTYLSFYPEGLREVFVFGGLPPLVDSPDEVYRRLLRTCVQRNEAYYAKFPQDVGAVKRIVAALRRYGDGSSVVLPSGGYLSARVFLQLGLSLGFHAGIDSVHEIVLRCDADLTQFGMLTRPSLGAIERALPFDEHVLYAVLHEAAYCQKKASNWSAERVMREEYGKQFSLDNEERILFTGETIHPFMFVSYTQLRALYEPARHIAKHTSWPDLYDLDQLSHRNTVPVYAAVYMHDAYVDYEFSMETSRKIKGCKVFVSNLLLHDAIRARADEVLAKVLSLRDDVLD
jgi:pimeloyl-ACP methyl ester carboxylesterase